MLSYIMRRVALAIGVALAVLVAMASLTRFIPGDPTTAIVGQRATPALRAEVRAELGLSLPLYQQIERFVRNALHGNLGNDLASNQPVTTVIGQALPNTLILAAASMMLAVAVAIPLAVLAAAHPNSMLDRALGLGSIALISIPSLVAALVLLIVFGVRLRLFPVIGSGSPSDPLDYLHHLVLPAVAIAIGWTGYLARLLRASLLEVLGSRHVAAARAFGIPQRVIVFQYALKNAFIPTMAIIGYGLASLTAGAVFVEVIFTRQGIGTLFLHAIETRDYPVIQGAVVVVAVIFIGVNLVVDLTYRFIDPRLRVEKSGRV